MLLLGFLGTNFLMAFRVASVPVFTVSKTTSTFPDPVYTSGLSDRTFFDTAYDKAVADPFEAPLDVHAIVSPHHLLVADRIAALFSSVASKRVKTVIVLSPNHFSRGRTPVLLSRGSWNTPYGIVSSDLQAIDELAEDVVVDETPFSEEHGIGSLTPFIARSFPNAKIIPVVIDETTLGSDKVALLIQRLALSRSPRRISHCIR